MDYDELLEQDHENIIEYCKEILQKDLTAHYNVDVVNCSTETDN